MTAKNDGLGVECRGVCRCGNVGFSLSGAPLITMACHCTGCQRMTGSAFSLSSLFPFSSFRLDAGETVIGGVGGASRHYFCSSCMTWLFTRPEALDDLVNVRSALLDNVRDYPPFIELWTSEKLPWASTAARYGFPTKPDPGEFPELLSLFAMEVSADSQR